MSKNKPFTTANNRGSTNFSAQHLLISKNIVHDLIRHAKIGPGDMVLDIGAGAGAITLPLAEKAAQVVAIESDPRFASKLINKTEKIANIKIRQADFLQSPLPKSPFSVVANIPYSITTPIFGKLLDGPGIPLQRAAIIVEKGAAKRFTSHPITDPRILKWRMWFDLQFVRTVAPSNFSPPPKVDSAILCINRRKNPTVPLKYHARFMALAVYGLRSPRLPVSAAFAEVFSPPQITKLARTLSIDRNMPVSQLNEQQWGQLFMAMLQHVLPARWPRIPKQKRRN
ncbi:23S rRNA (adenine-N6)-dimethyltransferase [Fontibacillus phaseoli]|uniref:rRNA adenine N-6-methyltransferase n=1 Tax=Fontibacillus phaseoli TaxID=1416533 RepID=A0A369BIS2_9BACL|nr:23S ribosomal RNA methyltransferase Erm [Fontibacillus phaseoli]RCX20327.1 23S rRNA (adenine-N6)-dimethyltransferase [Fontibacillus phaseoli]